MKTFWSCHLMMSKIAMMIIQPERFIGLDGGGGVF